MAPYALRKPNATPPCCRSESASEVDVASRERFSVWVCHRHNAVNSRLGKPIFPCDYASLKQRWGPP